MGVVDLVNMLVSLYQVPCKTKHWYQKIFWHLIDMAQTNAWIRYYWYFCQNVKPHKNQKSLLQFSLELSDVLILANKVNPSSSRRRPPQNKEVWRLLPQVKSLLKQCLSPMFVLIKLPIFVLIKLHIGKALMSAKIDADYPVWTAECNVPNARSFSV